MLEYQERVKKTMSRDWLKIAIKSIEKEKWIGSIDVNICSDGATITAWFKHKSFRFLYFDGLELVKNNYFPEDDYIFEGEEVGYTFSLGAAYSSKQVIKTLREKYDKLMTATRKHNEWLISVKASKERGHSRANEENKVKIYPNK